MNNVIEITGLGKRYFLGHKKWRFGTLKKPSEKNDKREIWALKDIDLEVPRARILGVIGPNGAGKTTLLKVLARITQPTEGLVTGRGRVVPLLEVGASFHPQFTGRENIHLNAAMFGISRREVDALFDDIVSFAEAESYIDRPVREMSSGMYLRLAFSVAISLRPEILIADEVLAVGDARYQQRCLERVRRESENGMTVLFVSHDMAAILDLCDEVIWLDRGRLRQRGAPDKVVAAYEREMLVLRRSRNQDNPPPASIVVTRLISKSGAETATARCGDPVRLELAIEAHAPNLALIPGVDVYCDEVLLLSSSSDCTLPASKPGLYTASVAIPTELFTAKAFRIFPKLFVKAGAREGLVSVENALGLRLYEGEGTPPLAPDEYGREIGPISGYLTWRLSSTDEPEEVA